MRDIRLYYPGAAPVPDSLREVDAAVTPVAADVENPAGDTIINVGNAAEELVAAAPVVAADWVSVTYDGETRLRYTNSAVADNVRPGDEITIDIDGVEHTLTVHDVNPLTGEVYFEDNSLTGATIGAATNVSVTTVASEASISGFSTRIARYNQTAVAAPTDTPISTQVVYIQDTVYEDASFTPDAETLYLIWEL